MPGEDEIEIPEEWRRVVHPRRGGMRPLLPAERSDDDAFKFITWDGGLGLDVEAAREDVLRHPATDAALATLARSGESSVAADGVRLALAPSPLRESIWYSTSLAPIRTLVAERGLAHAAAAFVASCAYYCPQAGRRIPPLVRHTDAGDMSTERWTPGIWDGAALHLRRLLATTTDEIYNDTRAELSPLRKGLLRQRIVASYLLPDICEWVAADFAALPKGYQGPGPMLFYSASTIDQLGRFRGTTLDDFVTAFDTFGNGVAGLLGSWLARGRWDSVTRRDALEVLTRIPTDDAFETLLAHLDVPDVLGGVSAAADSFPKRAARMLAERRGVDVIDVLFIRHVGAHPDVDEARLVPRQPDAPADAVPHLLRAPPWSREPIARVAVTPSPDASQPRMVWQDGERERWSYDWRASRADRVSQHLPLALKGEAPAEFYISAPADLVRPHLAQWKAESTWFYLEQPQVVVGKYELEALTPMLRLARKKPAVGAALLMPYLAQDVADLTAEWLTRSRQFHGVAKEWLARHGADAAALLIPTALGSASAQSRTAALALTRIDKDDLRAAADALGCREQIEAFLQRDPLDLVPSKIPPVPRWADPKLLPQIQLANREYALPSDATAVLLRMTAMSQLDAPYEGLRMVAERCDPVSLADFAWSLYRLWETEGRPSKHAWAMNALGYFGDDRVADRLAPLIRRWPSEGAAQRAKRGAEILAAISSDRALSHLSALARNAKSTPLRTHATAFLDRIAADRGMLPEQLDDLLAPDLGIDTEPVTYRGMSYDVELGASNDLVLRDPTGRDSAALPKATSDDEQTISSAWKRRRRKAKPIIADQIARLEEAMIVQRRWARSDFLSRVAGHPLVARLARRLVWTLDDDTVGLDALGDLVDPTGALVADGQWVRLAHPAVDDLERWAPWLSRVGAPQPFPQAEREVFLGEDPSAYWQHEVAAVALFSLTRDGWHWGASGRRAQRTEMFRPFGAEGRVVLTIEPGVSAVANPDNEPRQTITGITFESAIGELGVFSDLPRVTRSELVRSLRHMTAPAQEA